MAAAVGTVETGVVRWCDCDCEDAPARFENTIDGDTPMPLRTAESRLRPIVCTRSRTFLAMVFAMSA